MLVTALRCETQSGVPMTDIATPRLSWRTRSTVRNDAQTAYQVQAGLSAGGADLWDTGKVTSAALLATYAGAALASRKIIYWQVRVWDAAGNVSQWTTARFEVGLLATADWSSALQIAYLTGTDATVSNPAAHLRKDFTAQDKAVVSARLYATAMGVYRPFLNGARVGNEELSPGWVNYSKRWNYQRYDVTALIRRNAANALGLTLGDGWGVGNLNRGFTAGIARSNYGTGIPYGLAVLYIDYADGTFDRIVTGATWRGTTSANLSNDLYNGGATDFRQTLNYTDPAISPAAWPLVSSRAFPAVQVKAQPCEPIRRRELLTAVARTNPTTGVYVFDMGVNHSGFPRITIVGATAGQVITVLYGEKLNADGTLHRRNLRTAYNGFSYVCQGLATETFEPLHAQAGGQYISVTGYPGVPALTSVQSVRIMTDMRKTASFSCSNASLNAIFAMVERTIDANVLATPTDCHQRDERLGWAFDTHSSIGCMSFIRDSAAYLQKYNIDLDDAQTSNGRWPDLAPSYDTYNYRVGETGWHHAGYIVPMSLYQFTGDLSILAAHWSAMKLGFSIEPRTNYWGDFLYTGPATNSSVMIYAFSCRAAQIMVQAATALNDAAALSNAQTQLASFLSTFQTYIASDGTITGDSQTGYALALAWGLCGDKTVLCLGKLVASLNANGILCGLVGTTYLLDALTLNGRADLALSLATNAAATGWAMNAAQGLTTTPERWDGFTRTMVDDTELNSLCHHVRGGPIGEWMIRRLAGIDYDPSAPGFKKIVLRPFTAGLTYASATFDSARGRILSSWAVTSKGFQWDFEVPAGSTATITMPVNRTPKENGVPVTFTQLSADPITGNPRYQVGSGTYSLFA